MQVRVVIQARTSSSRLPGKSMLPIGGIPAAILAVLRARDPKWQVVLATSDERSDDPLVRAAKRFSIMHVRGPLEDVLGRFILATEGLDDDALVVRLTADNLFPDRDLVSEVVAECLRGRYVYLFTWSPALDVPYGLSVEVFRVAALREAAKQARSKSDREHVTPWIYRTYGRTLYRPRRLPVGYGRLRCTMDTLDDYLRMENVFAEVAEPISAHWLDLCHRLNEQPGTPRYTVPVRTVGGAFHGKLVLGTAQLGLTYGITNRTGEPAEAEAEAIIKQAIAVGITHVDTARAYGRSEGRIGRALRKGVAPGMHVVTKLQPLEDVPDDASPSFVRSLVDASIFRSCRELGLTTLPTLLLHRAEERRRWHGAAWQRLKELRAEGVIGTLGLSAENPQQVLEVLADRDVQHIQLPFNILDWRWKEARIPAALARRPDVVVHGRSALLQGLLANLEPTLWSRVAPEHAQTILSSLEQMRRFCGRESVLDMALAYVRGHPWVHGVVIGVERADQLHELARLFCKPALTEEQIEWVDRHRVRSPAWLLNPRLWRK